MDNKFSKIIIVVYQDNKITMDNNKLMFNKVVIINKTNQS